MANQSPPEIRSRINDRESKEPASGGVGSEPFDVRVRRSNRRLSLAYAAMGLALLVVMMLSILTGDSDVARVVTLPRAITVISHHLFRSPLPDSDVFRQLDAIVWDMRVPR